MECSSGLGHGGAGKGQQPGNQRLGVLRACIPKPTPPQERVEVSAYHHPQPHS